MDNLEEKNRELSKMLYQAKQSLDIYKFFALNAEQLKKNGKGRKFFAYIQQLTQKSFILDICKIFEEEKKNKKGIVNYPLNSILGIINYIEINDLSFIRGKEEFILQFVNSYLCKDESIVSIQDIKTTYKLIVEKFKCELKCLKELRDKYIAHPESAVELPNVPSFETNEQLLIFGMDFYSMITSAYFDGIVPCNINDQIAVISSLKNLLAEIGVKEIKEDFQ